jgi:arsenate reductase (thioredoxin)
MMRVILAVLVSAAVALSVSDAVAQRAATPTKVFFMCPHGAAKSVLASAYFQRLAKERGLNVVVDAGGTEPDPAVSPAVADHLKKNGYPMPIAKPRLVTPNDLASADIVVSLGCDMKGLPAPKGRLLTWDVPGPGENLPASSDAIRKHAEELVEQLANAAGGGRP